VYAKSQDILTYSGHIQDRGELYLMASKLSDSVIKLLIEQLSSNASVMNMEA